MQFTSAADNPAQSTLETIVGWILGVLLFSPYLLTLVVIFRNVNRTWQRLALIVNAIFAVLLALLIVTGLNWSSPDAPKLALLIAAIGVLPFALNVLVLRQRSLRSIVTNAG